MKRISISKERDVALDVIFHLFYLKFADDVIIAPRQSCPVNVGAGRERDPLISSDDHCSPQLIIDGYFEYIYISII